MTDDEISQLLRSQNSIVLIEAPAGCGKTYQAASYARDAATKLTRGKILVLTHTHAACSVIAANTNDLKNKLDIQTLDSLINQVATAYRTLLGLPDDVASWARANGYEDLADKVALFLKTNPMVCRHLATIYPIIICDEHQDSNKSQDEIVRLINKEGSLLRVFGDPMQIIPGGRGHDKIATETQSRWESLKERASFGSLEVPHRWDKSDPDLGKWILDSRSRLKEGGQIDLSLGVPSSVDITFAENISKSSKMYILKPENSSLLWSRITTENKLLLLAGSNAAVLGVRAAFNRSVPIWEGHTRGSLEKYIDKVSDSTDIEKKLKEFILFVQNTTKGFSNSSFANRLRKEVDNPTPKPGGKLPPKLKKMAQLILEKPNHHGFANAASYLRDLIRDKDPAFKSVQIDYPIEFSDLIKLSNFSDPIQAFAEIAQRRSRAHPKPPSKALSTIHKSKGLESENVILFACDSVHFPNTASKRNLLYVALSRTTSKLTIVLSKEKPSPFFKIS